MEWLLACHACLSPSSVGNTLSYGEPIYIIFDGADLVIWDPLPSLLKLLIPNPSTHLTTVNDSGKAICLQPSHSPFPSGHSAQLPAEMYSFCRWVLSLGVLVYYAQLVGFCLSVHHPTLERVGGIFPHLPLGVYWGLSLRVPRTWLWSSVRCSGSPQTFLNICIKFILLFR